MKGTHLLSMTDMDHFENWSHHYTCLPHWPMVFHIGLLDNTKLLILVPQVGGNWRGRKLHLPKLAILREKIIHSEVIMLPMTLMSPMVSILLSMSSMTHFQLFILPILSSSYYQDSTISTSLPNVLYIGICSTSAGQSTLDLHLVHLGHDLLQLRHDFLNYATISSHDWEVFYL